MSGLRLSLNCRPGVGYLRGGGNIDGSKNAEDIGLHRTGEQTEKGHNDGEDKGRDGK